MTRNMTALEIMAHDAMVAELRAPIQAKIDRERALFEHAMAPDPEPPAEPKKAEPPQKPLKSSGDGYDGTGAGLAALGAGLAALAVSGC